MGGDLARLVWLVIFAALFVNLTRGTTRQWLRGWATGKP